MMNRCEVCGEELLLNEIHDATYCAKCNEWKEEVCDEPDCEFCCDRPERPLNNEAKE